MIDRRLLFILGLLLNVMFVNGLVVEETSNSPNQPVTESVGVFKQALASVPWGLVITITIVGFLVLGVFGLIVWIAFKIYKKIKEDRRKKDDLEYYKYQMDFKMCVINADRKYVHRVWYKLWLGKKRAKVYALTSLGRKYVGDYMGEAVKKEGFFVLGLYQVYTFFNRETDVVIIPYPLLKQIVRKNDDFTIDLVCEGIDEVMSSEYFSIPVLLNMSYLENRKTFADFSNQIMEEYFKEYAYRDVIRTSIQEFKEGIRDATEMNPSVQVGRKISSDLKE